MPTRSREGKSFILLMNINMIHVILHVVLIIIMNINNEYYYDAGDSSCDRNNNY
jgi:hypothetical protein